MIDITAGYLAQALEASALSFADGELAYLALTSKVQLPLRDRLAWSLATQLPGLVVARGWKRTDIAILDPSALPLALVEAKALYTFDVATPDRANVSEYARMVKDDMAKASALLGGRPGQVFALVLVTHPMDAPPAVLKDVFKYPGIRTAFNRSTEQEIRAGAKANLSAALEPLGPAVHGSLDGGSAFGVRVVVDYTIVGPVAVS
ncbi:hypothetical protein [Arthrobacter zhaoguopingii]|uniref:hypothetical protein n=1 Tax=Arthrobacter zhaoguopingii TaxID=2681491 RepID=UPI0013590C40|nr:hypothetical protein [Arthrobacter zhaoguopingii]